MKKNILSLAVASGVAGLAVSAQAAMYLNPEGTGQVLLFPYYNAENGNETSMHIVNTSETDAKAVKVRFMEYVNSQEVLDFNLYLSPNDHFAFTIFANPNGEGAAIITRDNSCTVPALGDASLPAPYTGSTTENADGSITRIQPFLPYQYDGDDYDSDYRTNVGHVEVIEMGVLEDGSTDLDTETDGDQFFTPASWATHDATGVPANCAALVAAWTEGGEVAADGVWASDLGAGYEITAPTGGLYGLSSMLNNSDAAAYGIEPAAIADFWTAGAEGHSNPGSVLPSLASGDADALIPNAGGYVELGFATADAIDAVSSLFMATDIANDVMTNADLSGETDWVVTFPTRRYYVNVDPALTPFTDPYVGVSVAADEDEGTAAIVGAPNSSCEDVVIDPYDREEANPAPVPGSGPIFSPPPPTGDSDTTLPKLCYETNTIAVNGVSALNATVSTADLTAAAISLTGAYAEGWQGISFNTAANPHAMPVATIDGADATAGETIDGLPVMGFAAFEYTNATSNYGFVSDHKTAIGGSALD